MPADAALLAADASSGACLLTRIVLPCCDASSARLRINSCSPGYILTDLTAGMGATKRPEESNCHVAALFLLFGDVPHDEVVNKGRYYGSDAVRSPIDVYRGPGDPPYVGD